jgi:hypothetical protein
MALVAFGDLALKSGPPQLGDPQRDLVGLGVELAVVRTGAVVDAVGRTFVLLGAAQGVGLGVQQGVSSRALQTRPSTYCRSWPPKGCHVKMSETYFTSSRNATGQTMRHHNGRPENLGCSPSSWLFDFFLDALRA